MRATHRTFHRAAAWALGATLTLTGCGPEQDVSATPTTTAATGGVTASPSPTVRPSGPTPSASPKPSVRPCPLGSRQREVEAALAKIATYGHVVVDGKQTAEECETIKRFQRRMGISPASGKAGTTTSAVARRIAATDTAACKAGTATMACVDLTHQTFFIMKGGKVVLGPTVTRTGMAGYATTAGTYSINDRSLSHWSRPYKVWLPYWQHFNNGMGLHETTTYIHNSSIGSHGCVNLLHGDAKAAYSLLGYGSKVRLYGRRPGT